MTKLTQSPVWQKLQQLSVRKNFTRDEARIASCGPLRLDYSRHLVDDEIMQELLALVVQQDLSGWREKMFAGEVINHTEKRAVLHTALRAADDADVRVAGKNVMTDVVAVKKRLYEFANRIRAGKKFKSVVNIGIGGSDLGPKMVTEALKPYHDTDMAFHFVSNIDATHLMETLKKCDPATTLFIVASKTFTTIETLTNAKTARDWLVAALGENAVADHFVAAAAAEEKVRAFGIDTNNMFEFWDWVGGRYSVWSAIGLPLILAVGPEKFEEFLSGARAMDEHFKTAAPEKNLPVLMGLLGVWYRNFHKLPAIAVLPYDQYLDSFARYLQQLDMESNGKSVDRDGAAVDYDTGPIVFGEPGTNGQHAFYQLIHQGTTVIPCDFIVTHDAHHAVGEHHKILLANALAQPDALWQGKSLDAAGGNIYRAFPGQRPSNILHIEKLDAHALGMLIALYEQKVFVQSVIWNLNAFDQFGVELGKEMANKILG